MELNSQAQSLRKHISTFEKQIQDGGPVTVTDKQMERFLMTIPEASQLVIQAGALGENGDSFVLDMGKPVRILDMAKQMIAFAGFVLDKDITIQITGLRPGEKLSEELWYKYENPIRTKNPKIFESECGREKPDLKKLAKTL